LEGELEAEVLVGTALMLDIPSEAFIGIERIMGVGDALAEAMMETTAEAESSWIFWISFLFFSIEGSFPAPTLSKMAAI
jgi:hypothetical protein